MHRKALASSILLRISTRPIKPSHTSGRCAAVPVGRLLPRPAGLQAAGTRPCWGSAQREGSLRSVQGVGRALCSGIERQSRTIIASW